MLSTLDSTVDLLGKGLHDHVNEHKNLHFDNDGDIVTSSKKYEECCYNLDLNLCVSYPKGSGPIVKKTSI